MKMHRLILISIFLILVNVGCSHVVYRMEAEEPTRSSISKELKSNCSDNCSLQRCWRETPDVTVCDVTFNFQLDSSKKAILLKASQDLASNGFQVGFCGRDSAGTQLVAAFFRGAGGGLAAGAIGGSVSPASMSAVGVGDRGSVSTQSNAESMITKACSSTPVVEN